MLCRDQQELEMLIGCAFERGATPEEIKDIVDREYELYQETDAALRAAEGE